MQVFQKTTTSIMNMTSSDQVSTMTLIESFYVY